MQRALIIFTKNPVFGRVKTRLAKGIGDHAALEAYLDLIQITASACKELDDKIDIHVYYSDHLGDDDAWSGINCTRHIQHQDKDLGIRMKEAFRQMFRLNYSSAVIIGSDCPYLDAVLIEKAFNKLDDNDLVIGPSLDGGFYLLGVHGMLPLNFSNITWSTESVYNNFMENSDKAALRKYIMPILEDVDDKVGFERFKKSYKHLNCNKL